MSLTPANPPHSTSPEPSKSTDSQVSSASEPILDRVKASNPANIQTGVVTSDTPTVTDEDVTIPEVDPNVPPKYPSLNDPVPNKLWHSKTNRSVFREVKPEDVVFLREQNGNVRAVDREALLDTYGSVQKKTRTVNQKTGKAAELIHTNEGGVIVLSDGATTHYDSLKLAEADGFGV